MKAIRRSARTGTESLWTLCWRGTDSNHRFRAISATVSWVLPSWGRSTGAPLIRAVAGLGKPIESSGGVRRAATHRPDQAASHQGRAVGGASASRRRRFESVPSSGESANYRFPGTRGAPRTATSPSSADRAARLRSRSAAINGARAHPSGSLAGPSSARNPAAQPARGYGCDPIVPICARLTTEPGSGGKCPLALNQRGLPRHRDLVRALFASAGHALLPPVRRGLVRLRLCAFPRRRSGWGS